MAICEVCGHDFEPKTWNAKYCSKECSAEGRRRRRRAWEDKTGYRDQQRERMRKKRRTRSAEAPTDKRQAQPLPAQPKKRKAQVVDLAAALDQLAEIQHKQGNTSAEYWEAYKEYDQLFAAAQNKKSASVVNDIVIDNPDFGLAVSLSIETLGTVSVDARYIELPAEKTPKNGPK